MKSLVKLLAVTGIIYAAILAHRRRRQSRMDPAISDAELLELEPQPLAQSSQAQREPRNVR